MKHKELTLHFYETNLITDLEAQDSQLLGKAGEAALRAYAPYSGFRVGAALRLKSGKIVEGNNQENAAYPSGLCAERVAIFAASSQFPGEIIECIAITINTDSKKVITPVPPCGACRQVIAEYEHNQGQKIRIIFSGETGHIMLSDGIENLLPMTFNSTNLQHLK